MMERCVDDESKVTEIKKSSSDFPFICRICFGRNELRLFKEEEFLWNQFLLLTRIQIQTAVDFPKNVCITCLNELNYISHFIEVAKITDSYFIKHMLWNKTDEKSFRFCRACFSKSNLSPLEENVALLQVFRNITKINLEACTNSLGGNSICYECTFKLKNSSSFLDLAMTNNEILKAVVTTDIKKETVYFEGIAVENDQKSGYENLYESVHVKEEEEVNADFHGIREDVSDSESVISSGSGGLESSDHNQLGGNSSGNDPDQRETGIETDDIHRKPTKSNNSGKLSSPTLKRFRCNYCNKEFAGENTIRTHMQIHSGRKPYRCYHCGKRYTLKKCWELHLVTHIKEKPFECDDCGRRYLKKRYLERHLVTHRTGLSFNCESCDQEFAVEKEFESHLLTHIARKPSDHNQFGENSSGNGLDQSESGSETDNVDRKPTKSDSSGKLSSPTLDSKSDTMTQIQEKQSRFRCKYCNIEFAEENTAKTHMEVHSGRKPYKCYHCPKRYNSRKWWERHLVTHIRKKPYGCKICGKRFGKKPHLVQHSFTHSTDIQV